LTVPLTAPVAALTVYATYCSWPTGIVAAMKLSAIVPGVLTPAESSGRPDGSVSVYVTEIVPLLAIAAELAVIVSPGRTNSTVEGSR
jgi:hypothetical protein